jgi:hypothetical protein
MVPMSPAEAGQCSKHHTSKPICFHCRIEYQVEENDFICNDEPYGDWPPTFWSGAKMTCPQCGCSVISHRGEAICLSKTENWPENWTFAHSYYPRKEL